jgi:hypothetical protein
MIPTGSEPPHPGTPAHRGPLRTRLTVLLFSLFLALWPSGVRAGRGGDSGAVRIDDVVACEPRDPDVAALPGGGFAAVWVSESQRIVLRAFDADFEPAGPETVVTDEPPEEDTVIGDVAVAADPAGRLAVAWVDSRARLQTRLFDPTGVPRTEVLLLDVAGVDPELDLAAVPDGSFVVVWQRDRSLTALRFDGSGAELHRFDLARPAGPSEIVHQPSVAVLGTDRLVIAWNYAKFSLLSFSSISQGIFDLEGDLLGGGSEDFPHPVNGDRPAVAARPSGGFVRVWRVGEGILFRGFDTQGNPSTPEVQVGLDDQNVGTAPDLAVTPDGTMRVAWEGNSAPIFSGAAPPPSRRILLRRLTPAGQPLGPVQTLGFGLDAYQSDGGPRAVSLTGGDTLVVARHLLQPFPADPVPCSIVAGIFARTLPGASLVVADRFRVTVDWHDAASGDRGVGMPGPQTADSGSFWFFEPDNLELIVKMIDGRSVNGHFWFFYGALSNVGYRITVTDLLTGQEREYENPQGRLASFADVTAFREPRAFPPSAAPPPGVLFLTAEPSAQIDSAAGPCSPPELPVVPRPGLCLADRRFEVEVEWFDPRSDLAGVGHPIEVNDVTGAFWFFRPSNVELVVKVLDARTVNGRFWVLYGSLTDVAFTLRVRHSETLDQVEFDNAPFEMSSGADTSSLAPPECNCPLAPPVPVCGLDGVTYNDACLARCVGWVGVAHPGPCEEGSP